MTLPPSRWAQVLEQPRPSSYWSRDRVLPTGRLTALDPPSSSCLDPSLSTRRPSTGNQTPAPGSAHQWASISARSPRTQAQQSDVSSRNNGPLNQPPQGQTPPTHGPTPPPGGPGHYRQPSQEMTLPASRGTPAFGSLRPEPRVPAGQHLLWEHSRLPQDPALPTSWSLRVLQ